MTTGALRAPNPHDFVRTRSDVRPAVSPPGHVSSVVVFTSAKDGAGRTTLAAHLAVAVLRQGVVAGVLDLDWRDRGLTRWARRRARRAAKEPGLVVPAALDGEARDEAGERARLPSTLDAMRRACPLVIIDAPAGAGGLARDAIARADRVVTVVPDSAAEADKLTDVDISGRDGGRPSAYAKMIWDERLDRARRQAGVLDWRLVRSRSFGDGAADAKFEDALRRLGAHPAPFMFEDRAWRAGFDEGLTAFDLHGAGVDDAVPSTLARELLITLSLPCLEGARLAL